MNEFLNKIKKGCIDGWTQYRVLPSLTAAQAVLESGWGKYAPHNALFGIKADRSWKGRSFSSKTQEEYEAGVLTDIVDRFRAYDSWEDSILDHGEFLNENPRYAKVIGETDYKKACQYIKDAGYATDSTYVDKLIQIIEYNKLYEWDPKEKNMSFQDFKNQTNGKAFNIDFAWGAQCWDGYAKYCQYLGVPYANCTVTGYVRDIWEQRHSNGTLKYFDEVTTMEVGDIAVFKPEGGTPLSHIAIFAGDAGGGYGWFYGQNQGGTPDGQGGMAFNMAKFPYSLTYPTAFRLKGSKQVKPSVQSNGFVKNERGTFTVTVDKLNVRNAPSTNSGVVAVYSKGQTFTYDSVYEINGYRWVSYVSYSGVRRYVAYRKVGGEKYGTVA